MGEFEKDVSTGRGSYGYNGLVSSSLFQDEVKCAASTGINVLVIGAGVGGLTTALECFRKGHSVRVFERSDGASAGGDMFTIGAQALRLLDNYPGEDLGEPFPFAKGAQGAEQNQYTDRPPMSTVLRPLFHMMLYHQLDRFGIKIRYGMNIREFYEDADRNVGGVVTDQGDKFEAHLVIAADGLHSKSRKLIPASAVPAKPTGRTIFRCAFPLDIAEADPLLDKFFGLKDGKDPLMQVWLGPETQAVVLAYVDKKGMNGRLCFGVSFRESDADRTETWSNTVSADQGLAILDRLPDWSC